MREVFGLATQVCSSGLWCAEYGTELMSKTRVRVHFLERRSQGNCTLTPFSLGCESTGIAHWLSPNRSARKLYSTLRVGREALVRRWPLELISRWLERLKSLPQAVADQMQLAA